MSQIRVILIEDNDALRETLEEALGNSPALHLLASFATAEEGLEKLLALEPQVAVVDICLPGMGGIEFTAALKQMRPECEVLVLTAFDDTNTVMKALKAGATGYLVKGRQAHHIAQAVVDLWGGGAPMSAAIARKIVESFHAPANPVHESLSAREESILRLLAQGKLNKEIADITGIVDATVRFHLKNIYRKLHVNNRTEAVLKHLGRLSP